MSDILHGILAADLIGFQMASHARHFRQTISRILLLEALPKGIQIEGTSGSGTGAHKGRFVDVGVFPGYRCQSAAGEEVGLIFCGMDPCWRP
jgi:trehalose-6-phosphate synthase